MVRHRQAVYRGFPLMALAALVLAGCGGGGGGAAAVAVSPGPGTAAPTVSLSAGPASVASGGTTVLTWSSQNATSCTAGGGWSGSLATSGTQRSGALAATTAFTVTCSGSGGSASQSVSVTVTNSPPGAAAGTYAISWDPVSDPAVIGFRVYYSRTSIASAASFFDVGAGSTSADFAPGSNGFLAGDTLHMAVATRGANGAVSDLSLEVTAVLQ